MPHTGFHGWCPGYLCLWVSSSTRVIRCPAQGKENDFVLFKTKNFNMRISKCPNLEEPNPKWLNKFMQLGHWGPRDQPAWLDNIQTLQNDSSKWRWLCFWVGVWSKKVNECRVLKKKRTAGARIKGALMIHRLKTPPGNCNQDYRFMSPKTKGWNSTNGALVEDVPIHVGVILRFSRRLKKKLVTEFSHVYWSVIHVQWA